MATQVVIDMSEYEELKGYKDRYNLLIAETIKYSKEVEKRYEERYDQKIQEVDTWIQKLDSKKWRVMFAGTSVHTSYLPTEVTRTKVWQIVPVEHIDGWLKWKTWIANKL